MLNKTILSVIYYVPIIDLYFPLPFILFLSFGVGVVGTGERGGVGQLAYDRSDIDNFLVTDTKIV